MAVIHFGKSWVIGSRDTTQAVFHVESITETRSVCGQPASVPSVNIMIKFPSALARMSMTPSEAVEIGNAIVEAARRIEGQEIAW